MKVVVILTLILSGCAAVPMASEKNPPDVRQAVASKTEPAVADGYYRIQAGDTGAKIAKAHNLAISDLAALNPDVQWARLQVGQTIRISPEK